MQSACDVNTTSMHEPDLCVETPGGLEIFKQKSWHNARTSSRIRGSQERSLSAPISSRKFFRCSHQQEIKLAPGCAGVLTKGLLNRGS